MNSDYTITFTLPSHGVVYEDHPEFGKPIELGILTTQDEKKLLGSVGSNRGMIEVIKNNTNPTIDVSELTSSDMFYVLLKLRILSYGGDYHINHKCEECGHEGEYKIDLQELEVKELPDDFEYPIPVELPISKRNIKIKFLTGKESDKIETKAKRNSKKYKIPVREAEFDERLKAIIVEIDGEPATDVAINELIKDMKSVESHYISHVLAESDPGVEDMFYEDCENCGAELEIPFQMHGEFFRPRFD